MERQPRLTYDDVREAAETLHRRGENVTIDALAAALGRGSRTTIHKYRAQWRAEKQGHSEHDGTAVPDALRQLFEEFTDGVWIEACEQAHQHLRTLREEAEQIAKDALAERQAALERASTIEDRNAELLIGLRNLEETLDQQTLDLNREREQRVTVETTLVERNAHLTELQTRLEQAELRQQAIEQKAQEDIRRMERELSAAERRVADTQQRAEAALVTERHERACLEERLTGELKQLAQTQRETQAKAQTDTLAANRREATLQSELATARDEIDRLAKAAEQGALAHEQLIAEKHQMETDMALVKKQLEDLTASHAALADARDNVQRETAELMRDKARLEGELAALRRHKGPAQKKSS